MALASAQGLSGLRSHGKGKGKGRWVWGGGTRLARRPRSNGDAPMTPLQT